MWHLLNWRMLEEVVALTRTPSDELRRPASEAVADRPDTGVKHAAPGPQRVSQRSEGGAPETVPDAAHKQTSIGAMRSTADVVPAEDASAESGAVVARAWAVGARDARGAAAPTSPTQEVVRQILSALSASLRAPRARALGELPPVARTKLLALAQLRRFRFRPMKLPWPVVLLGAPPPPSAPPPPGGRAASEAAEPALPAMPTDPSLLLLGLGEARFENSLWTSFDFDLDGIDVGAGSRTVWVARPSGGMWKIDSWSPAQPQLVSFPHGIKRISVSRPPSGTYQQEDPWVVASDGSVWLNTLGSWMMLSDDDTLDISAGHFSVYAAYPAVSDVAYRVTISGALETFYLTQAGSGWSPVPWYSPAPPATTTVALERQRLAPPYEAVWYVRADQHIGKLSNPLKDFGSLADDIIDVGAGAGVVWVVSGVQSPDAGARGNSIWRLDPSAPAGKGWDRLSPGWAVAVDADEDGNAWVLDSDGRLHVRGARMPAVFDNFRGKPKPGESWDEYFQLLTSTPGLYPELVIQSRLAGAGGTVVLRAWDDYAGLSPAAKTLYKSVLAVLLEKDRGIELLFCIAPIFTGALRVPPNLRVGATKTDDGTYIDFTLLLSAYLDVVKDLATVPGFVERVRYLSLGNEVDYYLSQWADGTKAWTTYFEFCAGVIQALRSVLPRTKFGVTWTVAGIQKHPAQWSKLMKSCDALFVNYYAVDLTGPAPTYQVKTLEQYGADFKKLIELADTYGGGKPIVLQEVGMPTDSLLGGSNFAQAKFIEFLLQQWDAVGIRIRFLSWFLLYDYLYDPTLKVSLVDPANANSPIQVDVSAYPKSFMTPPLPFWGEAHNIPGLFLGPYAPPKTSGLVTNADRVYWLNQSTTDGTHAQRLTRFLASCGLLAADGQPKHLPTLKLPPGVQNPSSGWDAFRFGLEQRRRQT